ncbi:hypothetical protein [Rhodospirillum sp. A1_3_36]|uniref:hypothetical protein n=1 Tax=Rhodospirillum sp. A1_3_36 TaxID=3391666 RepID=UPI0039A4D5DD
MEIRFLTTLLQTLSAHVRLGKTRLETLSLLIVGVISTRTVNLSHIAVERPGRALVASTYRRLQRFFQHGQLDDDWVVSLVVRLIGSRPPCVLCLDRTNWKLGRHDMNFLVLAVTTRRFRVPLMWTVLEHGGSSDTADRIALIKRYIASACRTASDIMARASPPRKAHGYYAKSCFRVGLDELRRRMRTDHNTATAPGAWQCGQVRSSPTLCSTAATEPTPGG